MYTMSADPSKPVTTVSKPQKRHAEMLQLALWEPSLQPEAGLAMPGLCSAPARQHCQEASRPRLADLHGVSLSHGDSPAGRLSWAPLGFCSWLCHSSSVLSERKTSTRAGEGRTTAQWEPVPLIRSASAQHSSNPSSWPENRNQR